MKRVNDTEGYCIRLCQHHVYGPPLLINHLHLDFPPLPMCMYTNQVDWMFPGRPHPHFRLGLTLCMGQSRVARPYFAPRERVWDMALEQLVALHRGVCTNHSTVFSHMIPEVCD